MNPRLSIFLVFIILLASKLDGQRMRPYDGPYIKMKNNKFNCLWIQKGKVKRKNLDTLEVDSFIVDGLPKIALKELDFNTKQKANYKGVEKFAANLGQTSLSIHLFGLA